MKVGKITQRKPTDLLFWLKLYRTSVHMEMFPHAGINLAQKQKIHNHEAALLRNPQQEK